MSGKKRRQESMAARNTKGWTALIALCIIAVALAACTDQDGPETHLQGTVDPAIIHSQNRLGLSLYHLLISQNGQRNFSNTDSQGVFLSPTSITFALGMALNGAGSVTQQAFRETLGWQSNSLEAINESIGLLRQQLTRKSGKDFILRIGNGLFQRDEVTLNESFIQRLKRYYSAHVESLDFHHPQTVRYINEWVEKQTEGRISDLIDDIDPEAFTLLINTVYFKGMWQKPFPAEQTTRVPFTLPSGIHRDVPMMQQSGDFDHYEGDGFQAVRLPYETANEGPILSMYVFLPDEHSDLDLFHQSLTYDNLETWFGLFSRKRGRVAIPRFEMDYKASLKQPLGRLGLGAAFDPHRADFGGMHPPSGRSRSYIHDVIHQSFLLVNEEGTEAAAATSVEFRVTSAPIYTFHFQADRPFFLVIRDDETEALLFLGSIVNPT